MLRTQACVGVQAAEEGRPHHFLVCLRGDVAVVADELLAEAQVDEEDLLEGGLDHEVRRFHVAVEVALLVQALEDLQGLREELQQDRGREEVGGVLARCVFLNGGWRTSRVSSSFSIAR
jgi:hypothetical protein